MCKDKMNDLPIWQNHEQRITELEVTIKGLSNKMDSVERTVKEGNKEQKDMLTMINNRMVDEFFTKKTLNLSNAWKLLFAIFGGGGLLYLIIEKWIGG